MYVCYVAPALKLLYCLGSLYMNAYISAELTVSIFRVERFICWNE
jgi:hypothetical protein